VTFAWDKKLYTITITRHLLPGYWLCKWNFRDRKPENGGYQQRRKLILPLSVLIHCTYQYSGIGGQWIPAWRRTERWGKLIIALPAQIQRISWIIVPFPKREQVLSLPVGYPLCSYRMVRHTCIVRTCGKSTYHCPPWWPEMLTGPAWTI
jgi:hypothetical protein